MKLPWPPSMNHYWRRNPRGGMLISKEGRVYKEAVIKECMAQSPRTWPNERLHIAITMHPPDRRKRDIDNLLKPILDALEGAGIMGNDNQIDKLCIERHSISKGDGYIIVAIKEMTP